MKVMYGIIGMGLESGLGIIKGIGPNLVLRNGPKWFLNGFMVR